MTVIADVIARFSGDTSGLDQTLGGLNDKFGGLQDSAAAVGSHVGAIGDAGGDAKESFGLAGAAMDELNKKAEGAAVSIKSLVTGAVGAAGFGSFVDMVKNADEELETLGVQFNNTFGSSGTSALKQATSDADAFGVSIGAAGNAYQSFGIATKGTNQNMQKDMKDFSDIAAGTGESIDSVSNSIGNYYQLVQRLGGSGGSASRYATSLLTSHIIDPQTYNQLRISANAGADPQQLLNTILADGESQYKGTGAAQSKTLGGELQTFKNQFTESGQGAMSPIMNEVQSGLAGVNKAMDSGGFKQATEDVTNFTSSIAKGAQDLEPFAKILGGVAQDVVGLAGHLGPVTGLVGLFVAGFVAFKAVEFPAHILQSVTALGSMATKTTENVTVTNTLTDAIRAQTDAIMANNAALQGGMYMGDAGPAFDAEAGATAAKPGLGQQGGRLGSLTDPEGALGLSSKSWMGIGGIAAIGAPILGNAIGGQAGSMLGAAGAGAGIGTMIDPGVGTAIGAAAGLVVSAFQSASNAANQLAASANKSAGVWDAGHPIGTANEIQSNFDDTKNKVADLQSQSKKNEPNTGFLSFVKDIFSNPSALNNDKSVSQWDEAKTLHTRAAGAEYNMNQNLNAIQGQVPNMTRSAAETFAQNNNIQLSANYQSMSNAIMTATANLNQLGGAAQATAEAMANQYSTLATEAGGTYGEKTFNVNKALEKDHTSLSAVTAQENKLGLATPTVPSQTNQLDTGDPATAANTANAITPAYAQQLNANMQATQQLVQSKQAETQAAWSVTMAQQAEVQATFSLVQAQFQLAQAGFALQQANFQLVESYFQLNRAELAMTVANVTQTDATNATTTAINGGYLPANANIAASLAQVTSLTSQQVAAINTEVSAYNALESQMYQVNASGQSLWSTYMQLQGAVQQLQAQTQQYQNVLNQPLEGSEQYSQQQEQYKVQEAALQQQIDTLELQHIPTESPQIQVLQQKLAVLQAQGDLSTQVNTQGVGQQQFQIQQAQLGPQQSYQAQMAAAQAMGQLNTQLFTAQQNLDAVLPTYTAVNTQLQIQQQKNTAVTQALSQQASADQGVITTNNSLIQAANSVVTANNGVATAANGVKTAQNGVMVAQENVTNSANAVTAAYWGEQSAASSAAQALNTFNAQAMQNLINNLNQLSGYITNIGVGTQQMANATNSMISAVDNYDAGPHVAGTTPLTGLAASGKPIFADGGWVPGSGPIDATLHGGEFVLSNQMLQQMAAGVPVTAQITGLQGSGGGSGSGNGGSFTLSNGAIQVNVTVSAEVNSLNETLASEIATTLGQAFDQLMQKTGGS